jgi:uncharacterized cupin superfamily protein
MTDQPTPKPLWRRTEIDAADGAHLRHPWNPNSDIHLKPLSTMAGLGRTVVTLARVPPGKESFVYHAHERDEEWVYILSGRGRAEIDGETYAVAAGDFMGFPTPSVPHHLVNDGDEDLVYLMGGERSGLDVGYFPRVGRTLVFIQSGIFAVDEGDKKAMTFADFLAKDGDG